MRKYYPGINICKFVFSILVVCIHTNPFIDYSIPVDLIVSGLLSTFAVPYFFVVSGFFSVSRSLINTLKRPMILWGTWAVLYFAFIRGWRLDFSQLLQLFFISGGYYHLWYMPVLVYSLIFCKTLLNNLPRKYAIALCITFYMSGCILYTYLGAGSEISRFFFRLFSIGIPFVYYGFLFADLNICCYRWKSRWCFPFVFLWIGEVLLLSSIGNKNGYTLLFGTFPIVALVFRYSCCYQSQYANKATKRMGQLSGILYFIHPIVMQLIENVCAKMGVKSINSFGFFSLVLFSSLCCCCLILIINDNLRRTWNVRRTTKTRREQYR